MQKLNKDGSVTGFDGQKWVAEESAVQSAKLWLACPQDIEAARAEAAGAQFGLWLSPGDDLEAAAPLIEQINIIAIEFPVFADGRGFSMARWVREKLGFNGEIIAVGGFMQDQLHYMKRCGFDGFIVADDANIESMKKSLIDFTDGYQASADQPTPLFRRRA